jgi:tetratricopeptide (TPR) repeat protein
MNVLDPTKEDAERLRILTLLLATTALFAWTLSFDFVFDDHLVILEDPLVVSPASLLDVFASRVRVAAVTLFYYRPLITILYRFDWALWGLNPAGYHLTNLFWHLSAVLLVYLVGRRTISTTAAWLGAMSFALLPAHVEAIAWIQGRVDLVSTTLALLALLALFRSRQEVGWSGFGWNVLASMAFFAALLAKEAVVTLPIAWLAWEIAGVRTTETGRLTGFVRRFGLLLACVFVYGIIRARVLDGALGFPIDLHPVLVRILAGVIAFGEYTRMLLAPNLELKFLPVFFVGARLGTLALGLLALVVLAGIACVTWTSRRNVFPWVIWIPVTLAPPMGLLLYAPAASRGFLTAERFTYLPSVGWCLLLGWLAHEALTAVTQRTRRWVGLAFGCVLIGYAVLTGLRLQPWADPIKYYRAVQAQADVPAPLRAYAHNDAGRIFLERGEFDQARQEFLAALRFEPQYAEPHNNLGVLEIQAGEPAKALPWLVTAVRLDPAFTKAYGNLARAYEALGDIAGARRAYEAALRLDPSSSWLRSGLARLSDVPPAQLRVRPSNP